MSRRWMNRLLFVGAVALSLSTLLPAAFSAPKAGVPDLPTVWRTPAANPKLVLLDFYSDYCGTCQMMEPHLQQLQWQLRKQLKIRHINVGKESTPPEVDNYDITGTPTLVLYDTVGKPVYRMAERISPHILERQVKRAAGKLSPLAIPTDLKLPAPVSGQEHSWKNVVLLAFTRPDCKECDAMKPYLNGFAQAGQDEGFHLITIDAQEHPEWTYNLGVKEFPLYILVDNAKPSGSAIPHGELFRVGGETDPARLWQAIRMYGDAGI